jgi:ABC-type antimicrobial peptide transport system permease subunit
MTVNANKRTNVTMLAAVIGASAVVAMGAVTMAITQEQATPAAVASSGMTMGATTKQSAPPSAPETSIAAPTVKALPFGGSGS